ncbi:lysophospholipase D GDPD1-like [Pollicipes pollicipes]|uniref:lysophospholipase D GDPD1-like n=1 Tax=Pollicipes pollicipes TaxID=41117 RepID=UPI00188523FA|nr:lysophospholipase D GDPD1-like [Pollicipes pollicipes]
MVSYAACSMVLLFFPGLLHKKKQPAFMCQHISHRGGAGERTENTLTAFEYAVKECGTDMLELDCQLTRDGRVVVAHDSDLRRAGRPGVTFPELDYDELPPLLHQLPLDFVPGRVFDASGWPDRRMPLLRHVFQRFPDTPINVDIKVDSDRLIASVGQMVSEFGRQRLTVWGNRSATVTSKCYKQDPSIPLLCSASCVVKIVLSAYVGLLPFLPLRETFFEVPMPSILYRAVKECGTDMLELDCQLTRDGRVVVAHDSDLRRAGRPGVTFPELDYDELPPLLHQLPLDFVPGRVFDASGWPDRRMPLLRHVFQRFPDTPINVDIKVDSDRLIASVGQMVSEFGRQRLTVWGNRSATVTSKCYKQDPSIPLLCSASCVVKIVLSAYVGLLPFLPLRETFFEVPMPSILYRFANSAWAKFPVWLADKLMMRPFILNHLRRRGMQVYLWVLNSEAEYRRAFELGATGVMTDYPSLLRSFLQDNPQYSAQVPRLKSTSPCR